MDFDLYHDESNIDGFWHGMLLVPRLSRQYLLNRLEEVRYNLVFDGVLSFKSTNKSNFKRFLCTKSWVSIGAGALLQAKKNQPYPSYDSGKVLFDRTGRKSREYKMFECVVKAKFILFRERDAHEQISDDFFPDKASKIETTLRMGLKGGLHLLGAEEDPINICTLHFDDHKHYGRAIDRSRIIGRLNGLRAYCTFSDPIVIEDLSSKHSRPKNERQSYEDCQLLQLTDLLIGAFRSSLSRMRDGRSQIVKPVHELVKSWQQGPARMRNSRWFRGYCLSQCYLYEGSWQFSDIIVTTDRQSQQELFTFRP